MIDKSEQWALDGNCNICRRKKYCIKPCTTHKSRTQHEMRCAIASVILKTLNKKQ